MVLSRLRPAVSAAGAAVVLLILPPPAATFSALTGSSPAPAAGVTAPVVAAVGLVAWVLAGWLLLVAGLALSARVPGRLGRLGAALAHRVAPAVVCRAVELALGLGVAATVVGGSPAWAAGPDLEATVSPAPAATASPAPTSAATPPLPDLDWPFAPAPGAVPSGAPGARVPTAAPAEHSPSAAPAREAGASRSQPAGRDAALSRLPTATPSGSVASGASGLAGAEQSPARDMDDGVSARPAAATGSVVVRPGDSLWRIAERQLAAKDGAPPSAARTAAAWPSWWAANRSVVGDDPDLVRAGTVLHPPPGR